MSTIDTLKEKWFIDVARDGQFPPQTRHPGTQVRPYTDGNLVEPIIDGQPLMVDFYQRVTQILNAPNPGEYQIWLAQWRLDPVKLLGETNPAPDAEALLFEAVEAGVKLYFMGSGHVGHRLATEIFVKELNARGGWGIRDARFPPGGSAHQKFIIVRGPANNWLAYVGSADLNFARWDTPDHADENPDRNWQGQGSSHDASVAVQGPAVHDLALSFAERWNDPQRQHTHPQITDPIPTDFVEAPIPLQGPHSVQVLRTYAIEPDRGYSWSDTGEFTIWASYLNAIKQARQYIYIEDQYFYSFGDPPAIELEPGTQRESDLVFQLGEAIKRGVDVLLLVPSRKGNRTALYQSYYRRLAARYLHQLAQSSPGAGQFSICHLRVGKLDPVVHAKLMLVDDEFTLIGSANVCQRSMAHDSELHLGIVDAAGRFTRNLRLTMWQEHLELDRPDSILDPAIGLRAYHENAVAETGRLRCYSIDPGKEISLHKLAMEITDPYKGPPRD